MQILDDGVPSLGLNLGSPTYKSKKEILLICQKKLIIIKDVRIERHTVDMKGFFFIIIHIVIYIYTYIIRN